MTSTPPATSGATTDRQPSDEEMRKHLKPTPKPDQMIGVLKKSFILPEQYLTLRIKRELDSYDDKNYWVEIAGKDYLVKVHNGVESKDLLSKLGTSSSSSSDHEASVIHLQNSMMQHLAKNNIATSAPVRPVEENPKTRLPTPGSIHPLPVHSREHSPCNLIVRLLKWVPGRTMESLQILPIETLADAGRYLAMMHMVLNTLDTTKMAAARRYHQWDGKNTHDLRNFVQHIDDPNNKSMVNSVIEAFQSDILQSGDAQNFQQGLIHGDFNDANILVDDNLRVSGVIDFGDSVQSWRILDVTVAMAYAMLSTYGKQQRSISAAAAVLRGYNSVIPLSPLEKKHLVLLVACRLSCSVTLGAYSHKQNPENEYLLMHSIPAWNALRLVWGADAESRTTTRSLLVNIFEQACSKTDCVLKEGIIDCSDLIFSDPGVADPLAPIRVRMNNNNNGGATERPAKHQRTI